MGDTEKQQTCKPNIPLLPLSPRGLKNEVDLFAESKFENEKNEDYFAAKNAFFNAGYGTAYLSSNTATKKHRFGLYEDIMLEIRNMSVLTPYQLHYLRGASNEQLMQIIETYNVIMRNVNEIL